MYVCMYVCVYVCMYVCMSTTSQFDTFPTQLRFLKESRVQPEPGSLPTPGAGASFYLPPKYVD